MTYNDKVYAFAGKWLDNVRTKSRDYAVAYAYKENPQKLILYKAYSSPNETVAESVLTPSWDAYLDDDVLEKEVFDALNKLKEDVERKYVSKKVNKIVNLAKDSLKEDGYDTSGLDVRHDDTDKFITIKATATDGPRKFVVAKNISYEEVLNLCDPVPSLISIMSDLLVEAEERIGDDMEPAEAIIIINHMLKTSQLSPWEREALGVALSRL